MIADLGVQHQYESGLFGYGYPSICIELERHTDRSLDPYFHNKQLCPDEYSRLNSENKFLSSIDEVFVNGQGWMKQPEFLLYLDQSRPAAPGQPSRDVFVGSLNIKYQTEDGYRGQADISPKEYKLLKEKTERELAAGVKPSLVAQIHTAQQKTPLTQQQVQGKERGS